MRKPPKQVLHDHEHDEAPVLAWIADASIPELQEFIRLAGKLGTTSWFVGPAQMALTARHARPHWSVWLTLILVILGIVISFLAWRFPVSSTASPLPVPSPSPTAAHTP